MSDPEERENQVASCFGQGIDPKDAIDGYGDDETDHNADETARAFENTDVDDDSRDYVVYRDVD